MVDTSITIDQPFFDEILPNEQPRKIPGAYEEASFSVQREYHYGEGYRDLAVQEGAADPKIAAANSREETIVYDSATGTELYKTWPRDVNRGSSRGAVEYDSNTDSLFIRTDRHIYRFDLTNQVIEDSFYSEQERIRSLHVGESGGFIFGDRNGNFQAFDSDYNQLYRHDIGGEVYGVYFDTPNNIAYVSGHSNRLDKWDLDTKERLARFDSTNGRPYVVNYDPSSGDIVLGGSNFVSLFSESDITTRIWSNDSTRNTVRSAIFGPNGDIFIGMDDGTVSKIDRNDGSRIDNVNVGETVSDIRLNNDGNILVGMRDDDPTLAIIEDNSNTLSVQLDTLEANGVYGVDIDESNGDRYFWDGSRRIDVLQGTKTLADSEDHLAYPRDPERLESVVYDSVNDRFIEVFREFMVARNPDTGAEQWRRKVPESSSEQSYIAKFDGSTLLTAGRGSDGKGEIRLHSLSDGSVTTRRKFLENNPGEGQIELYEDAGTIEIYVQDEHRGFVKLNDSLNIEWDYHQFDTGDSPASYAVDDTHLYVGHFDPDGIIKFNKQTGAIVDRLNRERTAAHDLQLGPDNTLVGYRGGEIVRVIDREEMEEVCCVYETRRTSYYSISRFEVDNVNNKVYIAHSTPYGIRSWNLETDKTDRDYYHCSLFGNRIFVNGQRITRRNANNVIEDLTLRAGDSISCDRRNGYVVGVKRSDR
jgi:hypothetical protein